MSLRDGLSIATPALALLIVLATPGKLRWARRPRSSPARHATRTSHILLAPPLTAAIVHAIT